MQYSKPIIVVSLHIAPPFLGAWASHLWDHSHEGLGLLVAIVAGLTAFATLMRDLYLEEIAEACAPTQLYHGSQAIEPPRPLPAFSAEENPSRVRIRPLVERGPYASVAPPDADQEATEREAS